MKQLFSIVPVLLSCAAVLVIMCGENVYNLGDDLTYRERFEIGKKYFEKGNYTRAKIVLDQIARLGMLADFSDSAQFLLAESHFNLRDYVLAENEYMRVLPGSPLWTKAIFMIGMCNYKLSSSPERDQKYKYKAINSFENFLIGTNPAEQDAQLYQDAINKLVELHGKLAKKDLDTGILYKKMGDYNGAIIYLNDAMFDYNTYGHVSIIPRALFEIGECYVKLEKYLDAEEKYKAVFQNFPEHPYAEKARKKLDKIKIEIAKADTTFFK